MVPGSSYDGDGRPPADVLRDGTRVLRRAEQVIEDILVEAYPGWRPMVPRARGWRFSMPDAIDVYRAVDSEAAADELHRAGFRRVTAHAHSSDAPCSDCQSWLPLIRPPAATSSAASSDPSVLIASDAPDDSGVLDASSSVPNVSDASGEPSVPDASRDRTDGTSSGGSGGSEE